MRPRHVLGSQRHDRNDVGGADPRMSAFVRAKVDQVTGARNPGEKRVDEGSVLGHEREDRAVVVGVGVNVENGRVLRERRADRLDRPLIPALGEVRDGLERQRHPPYCRRPVTRRRSSYRSLASLQRDNRVCRACAEAGYPLESLPVVHGHTGQRAYMFGQAPGVVEGEERRPWRGRAGRTLRRWLAMDEDEFYGTFYCASVTRCYPGRAPSGRGDRTPTPREQELCSFWRDWELRLLRPALLVPVGGLAIRHVLGARSLATCIGCRHELDRRRAA